MRSGSPYFSISPDHAVIIHTIHIDKIVSPEAAHPLLKKYQAIRTSTRAGTYLMLVGYTSQLFLTLFPVSEFRFFRRSECKRGDFFKRAWGKPPAKFRMPVPIDWDPRASRCGHYVLVDGRFRLSVREPEGEIVRRGPGRAWRGLQLLPM